MRNFIYIYTTDGVDIFPVYTFRNAEDAFEFITCRNFRRVGKYEYINEHNIPYWVYV